MKLPSVLGLKTTAITSGIALVVGLGGGWKLHDALIYQPHLTKDLKAVVKQGVVIREAEQQATTLGETHHSAIAIKTAQREATTRAIQKEIPRYVYVPPIAGVPASGQPLSDVPVGFGLLHDYAATATPPPTTPPAGLDLSAPSRIGVPALADTITYNYGVCKAYRDEAEGWRAWHRDLVAWWAATDRALGK